MVGVAAFFIAGCSAFFSVRGLGLLFIGSATAVMIMAASLEVGKLVAASFLYRYWNEISRSLRAYLLVAVLLLIGITSLGNYGYLARAYERTHTRVTQLEDQIVMLEKENADTQRQIDTSRGQLNKATDTGHESLASLQTRITAGNASLDTALARLQEKRTAAQTARDHDLQNATQQLAGRNDALTKALATEDTLIAGLNDQLAVLDRAVDAYTKQGGPGFFKIDSIKKGEELRDRQASQRANLTAQITDHRTRQEQLRADLAKNSEAADKDLAAVRQQSDATLAALDSEEKELRKNHADTTAQVEQQVTALQSIGQTTTVTGSTAIDALYQRIRGRNDEIRHLKDQIAGTDIGSYRFVARAFDASSDNVVKWLTLALVLVFDPLAVCLAVGFNVALLRDRRRSPLLPLPNESSPTGSNGSRRPQMATIGLSVLLVALGTGGIAVAAHYGLTSFRQAAQTKHAALVPGNSFAVVTLHPDQFNNPAVLTAWLGALPGKVLSDSLAELLKSGFDTHADVYAFAKFPEKTAENSDRPVMLAGLVARVTDPVAAEAALARMADQISAALRPGNSPSPAKGRAMIRFGRGRYLDPEGGFFTFGLADHSAVLFVELEGDSAAPIVESEMQTCLATRPEMASETAEKLPARALVHDSLAGAWLDASRFFAGLPKNPAAQVRYQQLQRFLDFDLVLKVKPTGADHLTVAADYAYKADRFKNRQQPTALQVLAELGAAAGAGVGGQLMDRCADTLDYDSLIERLRSALGSANPTGSQDVLVEKSFESDREAQFVVSARYAPTTGAPVASAK
ncbi:MAG: hypothetical protein WCS70_01825 [Verrucomicrobiota bacterium]